MSEISFDCTEEELKHIKRIVDRYDILLCDALADGAKLDKISLGTDLMTCHTNGCPLELAKLVITDDVSLARDVSGIQYYLDRSTGKLTNCFLPRFAAPLAEDRPN